MNGDGDFTAAVGTAAEFRVAVLTGGRVFAVRPEMAEIFVQTADELLARGESEQVVLSHADGVDLIHVGPVSLIVVLDRSAQPPAVLWRSAAVHRAAEDVQPPLPAALAEGSVRERILAAAYPLVLQQPARDLRLELLQQTAGVSGEEFRSEFATVETLVAECLTLREREWTINVIRAGTLAHADTAEGRLLAIFDVFDGWFHRDDAEAVALRAGLQQMGNQQSGSATGVAHLAYVRSLIKSLARDAGLADPPALAWSWQLLMNGAITSAGEGDRDAGTRAKAMAADLIRRHHT